MDVWPAVGDKLEGVDDRLRIVYISYGARAEDQGPSGQPELSARLGAAVPGRGEPL